MDDEGAGVTDVCKMREELKAFDQFNTGFVTAFEAECEDSASAFRAVLLVGLIERIVGQTCVGNPADSGMALEEFSNLQCVIRVLLHAQRQCLDACDEHEGIVRRDCGAEITQPEYTTADAKAMLPKVSNKRMSLYSGRGSVSIGYLPDAAQSKVPASTIAPPMELP